MANTIKNTAFEAATQSRIDRLKNVGYVPRQSGSLNNWTPSMPSPDNPPAEVGLPQDWDYQKAELGPQGEAMAQGQIGWTPHGEAYYGGNSGFANWFNRLKAGFNPSAEEGREAATKGSDFAAAAINSLFKEGDFGGFLGNTLQAFNQVDDILKNLGAPKEGEDANILNYLINIPGRVIAESTQAVVKGIGEAAEEVEQVRGGLQEASGREDQQAEHPRLAALQETLESRTGREETGDWFTDAATWASGRLVNWFVPALYSIEPIGILRDLASIPAAFQNPDEFKRGYDAGRILYTSFIDPAARQEYMRRYTAGENPYLLAEELQNPMAELGGELLADPLNLVGFITKPLRAANRVDDAVDLVGRAAPEVAEVMAKGDDLTDAAKAQRTAELIEGVSQANQRVTGKLVEQSGDIKFFGGTMEARAGYFSDVAGGFFKSIAGVIKDTSKGGNYIDDVLDVVKGFVLRASDDPEDIARGIDLVSRSGLPNDVAFSEASIQLGVGMRRLLQNEDGIVDAAGFIKRLSANSDDPAKLIDAFRGQLDDAAKSIFPPLRGRENLGIKGRAIAKMEDVSNNKLIGGINRFFASVYMGMSPGYYIRNTITNTFHSIVDGGPGTFFEGGKRISETGANTRTAALLNDVLPEAATRGIGAAGGAPGVTTEATKGLGRYARWFLEAGNEAERATSARLVYKSVRQTLDKSFTAIRRATEGDLKGVDGDILFRLLRDNNYDVAKAGEVYRAAQQSGFIDPIRSFEYITDEMSGILDDFDLADGYKSRILQTLDDAADLPTEQQLSAVQGAHKSFFKEFIDDYIDNMPEEAGRYFEGAQLDSGLAFMGESGDVADNINDLAAKQRGWNKILEQSLTGENGFVTTTEKMAERLGIDVGAIKASNPDFAEISNFVSDAEKRWGEYSEGMTPIYTAMRDATSPDLAAAWRKLGIVGDPPPNLTKQQLINFFWEGHYFPRWRSHWMNVRNDHAEISMRYAETLIGEAQKLGTDIVDWNAVSKMQRDLRMATLWDVAEVGKDGVSVLVGGARADNSLAVRKLGILNGVASKSDRGANLDDVLRRIINGNLPEGTEKFSNFHDIPFDVAQAAFRNRAAKNGQDFFDVLGARPSSIVGAPPMQPMKRGVPFLDDGSMPSDVRMMMENYAGLTEMTGKLEENMTSMFGQMRRVLPSAEAEASLAAWESKAGDMMNTAKVVAPRVASQFRDFALINYGDRRNFDTALGLLYPYHFWHTRTYANWARRIVSNPGVIAAYSKYKDAMAEIHAGMPDWWKYNVNSNELFGLDWNNPLYFNLEATLNPVRGLTDVDFNDRYKRVNWWTSLLDDLSKFGPTTWTPLSIAAAFALKAQGEDEAAARWGGRLIPQTQTLASAQSLGEEALGKDSLAFLDWFTKDPLVSLFSGGIDPYTRNRVGRALAAMIEEGLISEEVGIDAASTQEGEVWENALDRAINERAPGQLSSFFFGVGLKGRTASDMTTDQFYNDYYRLWNMRDAGMSPDEFRSSMADLETKYPFMDTLLLSRKAGPERDTALAYNVLGRLPPGGSSLAQGAGIDQRLISKFYDTKGDWEFDEKDREVLAGLLERGEITQKEYDDRIREREETGSWTDSERDRFMAGVADLGAVLAIPDGATQQEWARVRNLYSGMMAQIPEDVQIGMDTFFQKYSVNQDDGRAYLQSHPEVQAAMDFKAQTVVSDPFLAAYYGGIENIESYFRSLMWDDIESQMGDIWTKFENNTNTRAESNQYAQLKEGWLERIDNAVIGLARFLPEARGAQVREDAPLSNVFQEDFAASLPQNRVPVSRLELSQALGAETMEIVLDFLMTGDPLPSDIRAELQVLADQLGISIYQLLDDLR